MSKITEPSVSEIRKGVKAYIRESWANKPAVAFLYHVQQKDAYAPAVIMANALMRGEKHVWIEGKGEIRVTQAAFLKAFYEDVERLYWDMNEREYLSRNQIQKQQCGDVIRYVAFA
jgi:hypothetical protein